MIVYSFDNSYEFLFLSILIYLFNFFFQEHVNSKTIYVMAEKQEERRLDKVYKFV